LLRVFGGKLPADIKLNISIIWHLNKRARGREGARVRARIEEQTSMSKQKLVRYYGRG